jgi:hypothetical protein
LVAIARLIASPKSVTATLLGVKTDFRIAGEIADQKNAIQVCLDKISPRKIIRMLAAETKSPNGVQLPF